MKKSRYLIFLLLTIAFGMISCISFTLLCCNLNHTGVVAITSAIISIGGGALASVIVAWLLSLSEQKRAKREKDLLRGAVLLPAYNTIIVFLLNMARLAFKLQCKKTHKIKYTQRTWDEWLKCLVESLSCAEDRAQVEVALKSIGATCNNIRNRITEIRSNRILLLMHDMITNEEYYAFCSFDYFCIQINSATDIFDTVKTVRELKNLLEQGKELFADLNCGIDLNKHNYDSNSMADFLKETKSKTYIKSSLMTDN